MIGKTNSAGESFLREPRVLWNGCAIELHHGDITDLDVDAIVNAANSELWPGGGVCGAIHRRGGRMLADACAMHIATKGKVATGRAAMTIGGDLKARHVIHAVGPFYEDDPQGAPALLASAYTSSLSIAREHGLTSIAFPCIATGVYGYPKDEACLIAIRTVKNDLEQHIGLDRVIFCVFDEEDERLYQQALSHGPPS